MKFSSHVVTLVIVITLKRLQISHATVNDCTATNNTRIISTGTSYCFQIQRPQPDHSNLSFSQITVAYEGMDSYYDVYDSYDFFPPRISLNCTCECAHSTSQTYACKPNEWYTNEQCISFKKPDSYCLAYHDDNTLDECPYKYRICCNVFLNNPKTKPFRALAINKPFDVYRLIFQHPQSFHQTDIIKKDILHVPEFVKKFQLGFNTIVEMEAISKTSEKSNAVYRKWYYIEPSRSTLMTDETINEENYDLDKLGWFRRRQGEEIYIIDRAKFSAFMEVSPLKCLTKPPEFKWELRARHYYHEETLISPPAGKSVLDEQSDSISSVTLQLDDKRVIFSKKHSKNLKLSMRQARATELFYCYLSKQDDSQTVLTLLFFLSSKGCNQSVDIVNRHKVDRINGFTQVVGSRMCQKIVPDISMASWVCLQNKVCNFCEYYSIDLVRFQENEAAPPVLNSTHDAPKHGVENTTVTEASSGGLIAVTVFLVCFIIFTLLLVILYRNARMKNLELSRRIIELSDELRPLTQSEKKNEETLQQPGSSNGRAKTDSMTKIANGLRQKYLKVGFHPYSWFEQQENLPHPFHVENRLVEISNKKSPQSDRTIQLQDLFPENVNDLKRILITGQRWCGKSTLVAKIAHDWAEGDPSLAQFDAVYVISLRHVLESLEKTIEEESGESLPMNDHTISLLILDGFDGLDPNFKQDVLDIINKRKYANLNVIVTTRSVHDLPNESPWDKIVNIEQMKTEDEMDFLKTNFKQGITKDEEDMIHRFLSEESSPSGFGNPFVLLMLITVINKNELKGETKITYTMLYRLTMQHLIKTNFPEIHQIELEPYQHDILNEKGPLYEYANILFNKILEKSPYVIATTDIKTDQFTEILDKILRKDKNYKKHEKNYDSNDIWYPAHRTFGQFLVAYFLIAYSNHKNEDFAKEKLSEKIKQLIDSDIIPTTRSMLYPFLGGLLGQRCHLLIDLLRHQAKYYRACSFDESDNHKFLPILQIVKECEIHEKLLDSLLPFLPKDWTIMKTDTFFATEIHQKLLQHSLVKKRTTNVQWDTRIPVLFPTQMTVDEFNIDVFENSSSLDDVLNKSTITCNTLNITTEKGEVMDIAEHLPKRIKNKKHYRYILRITN